MIAASLIFHPPPPISCLHIHTPHPLPPASHRARRYNKLGCISRVSAFLTASAIVAFSRVGSFSQIRVMVDDDGAYVDPDHPDRVFIRNRVQRSVLDA